MRRNIRRFLGGLAIGKFISAGVVLASPTTHTVTGSGDTIDPLDGVLTLREAIANADDGDVINFSPAVSSQTIRLINGEITLNRSITVEGNLLAKPRILPAKANPGRLFSVAEGQLVMMRHLVLQGGAADLGGAIYSEGDLFLEWCRFEQSSASQRGGAIYHRVRSLEMEGCTFEGNQAELGGAVAVVEGAFCSVERCRFEGNVSTAPFNTVASGGALFSKDSQVSISRSAFAGNVADGNGMALAVDGGQVTALSCSFAGSVAPPGQPKPGAAISLAHTDGFFYGTAIFGGTGAAMLAQGGEPLVLRNCTLAGNARGGLSAFDVDVILENVLIWENGPSSAMNLRVAGTGALTVDHTLVEHRNLTVEGQGNLDGTDVSNSPGFGPEVDSQLAPFTMVDLTPDYESPVVDAGTGFFGAGALDLADQLRMRGLAVDLGAFEQQKVILHVDQSAPVEGADGLTWGTAFKHLNDALAASQPGDFLHLAGGLYHPDEGEGHVEGNVAEAFEVPHSLTILGGFPAGGGERDPDFHRTILSGDLGDDDLAPVGVTSRTSNIRGENSSALLVADWEEGSGNHLEVDGVAFTATDPEDGVVHLGGLKVNGGTHRVTNCFFLGCGRAVSAGDGAEVFLSEGEISGCGDGGRFAFVVDASVDLRNVRVSSCDGQFYLQDAMMQAVNLVYAGNTGSVLVTGQGHASLINASAAGNSDDLVEVRSGCSADLTNVLVWGNTGNVSVFPGGVVNYSHCVIEGIDLRELGDGNFNGRDALSDPGFGEYLDPALAPDLTIRNRDLVPTSPLVRDAGLSGDNPEDLDIEGRPRVDRGEIDLGAHEVILAPLDEDQDGIADPWEWRHFGGLGEGPADDSDGDGITTLAEYMHGLHPLKPNGVTEGWRLVTVEEDGELYQGIVYRENPMARGTLEVNVLRSEDLGQNDPWSSDGVIFSVAGGNDFEQIRRSMVPRGSVSREFLRLQIRKTN